MMQKQQNINYKCNSKSSYAFGLLSFVCLLNRVTREVFDSAVACRVVVWYNLAEATNWMNTLDGLLMQVPSRTWTFYYMADLPTGHGLENTCINVASLLKDQCVSFV